MLHVVQEGTLLMIEGGVGVCNQQWLCIVKA